MLRSYCFANCGKLVFRCVAMLSSIHRIQPVESELLREARTTRIQKIMEEIPVSFGFEYDAQLNSFRGGAVPEDESESFAYKEIRDASV